MATILAILAWLTAVVAFWILARRRTRKWQSLELGLPRAFVRSLAVSLALAPTGVAYVPLPVPATLALLAYTFSDNWSGRHEAIRFSLVCFLVFWAIAFTISLLWFLWRYDQKR